MPVPEGGIGRVLIYKTYKDPRTYMMNGEDIVVGAQPERLPARRGAAEGLRVHLVERRGAAVDDADGRLKLAFANPSGQSNPVTIHARKTTAAFTPSTFTTCSSTTSRRSTTWTRRRPAAIRVEQTYSDYRKGDKRAGSTRWRTCRCRI